ncbi:MAG: SUMF1/EgtB/PvdO family nonheme iron enzyme, partial [Caldilineaceae bacterium]|nr:SUMF1/EgtB/PvdO family nonheme iron enzyme [Caldilineaceae bacterium]
GDLPRLEALGLLEAAQYLGDLSLANQFLDYVDQRAGLLQGRGGEEGNKAAIAYTFPHRTFQEYLAGCEMLHKRVPYRELRQRAQEGDFWYLAAQLAAEELLYNQGFNATKVLVDLAYPLCPSQPPKAEADEGEWRTLLWAGHCARVVGKRAIAQDTDDPEGGPHFLTRLCESLLDLMRRSPLTPVERADAGRMLAVLGDPRLEVLDPLQIEWCEVPAGPFLMGSDQIENAGPQHTVDLPYTYKISRYPITNAQYRHFVDAGGYANAAYWPEAIAHERWRDGQVRVYTFRDGSFIDELRNANADYGEPLSLANHPVVGVSWYEALAFTRWLSDVMQESDLLPANWQITLPSEAEWEKAARGTDGRLYPWGNEEPDGARCNFDLAVGLTVPVGNYPAGASPYGLLDMAGNVWE